MINWELLTKGEIQQLHSIARRAVGIVPTLDFMSTEMDLSAAHVSGNPLDLDRMEAADDGNLMHDVLGIQRHIDRETGKLEGFFSPRYSKREG